MKKALDASGKTASDYLRALAIKDLKSLGLLTDGMLVDVLI